MRKVAFRLVGPVGVFFILNHVRPDVPYVHQGGRPLIHFVGHLDRPTSSQTMRSFAPTGSDLCRSAFDLCWSGIDCLGSSGSHVFVFLPLNLSSDLGRSR